MPTYDKSIDPAREVEQLREALDRQPVIEQAKGMLMLLRACSADEAFTVLRTVSQRVNVKVFDIAAVIVAAASGQHPPCSPDPRTVADVLQYVRGLKPGSPGVVSDGEVADHLGDGGLV
ncbi:ANTAR domain-containing protein [Lentzea guizhouensis]|uniref:ANTAR domain-containing protein n=1 Tax=Lentzea guizhouensis TaxID=1586287 RepID=UPI0009F33304|nr:ANTAR domain-containing protein [Lentzea guizhouensis]